MLTITPRASTVIQRVTGHPRLAPSSGLRIAPQAHPGASLEVTIALRPQPGDRVVEQDGGRLFLAPSAVARVDGQELDAVTDGEGRVQFVSRNAA
jgi:iron-sulfur cluster assembly protein